jgi:hypothetical protein
MPCDENTPLTQTEVDLLATYRSWARKGTLVDKLRQKMEKLEAREKIPQDKPIPVPTPPPDMSVPPHPMDGCGAAVAALFLPRDAEIMTAALAAVSAPGKRFRDQYELETELAMRGFYNEPGQMPETFKTPDGGGK